MKFSLAFGAIMGSMFACLAAIAAPVHFSDESILGQYTAETTTPATEIKAATLRFNADNQLVLTTDRYDQEYVLSNVGDSDVVFDEDGEPNCDGDEPSCYYDAHTQIRLGRDAKGIPQVVISITTMDAFDDTGTSQETNTTALKWANTIPDAHSFYLNVAVPADLAKVMADCKAAVTPTIGFGGVNNWTTICTDLVSTVLFRDEIDVALPYLWKASAGSEKVKELTKKEFRTVVLAGALKRLKALDQKKLKVERKFLVAQFMSVANYILNQSDRIFVFQFADTAFVYSVNTKTKMIHEFLIRNQK